MPLEFGLKDFIDIFLVALMLFYCYKVMKESRSLNVFFGVLIFVVFWLFVSQILEMKLLGSILDKLVSVGMEARYRPSDNRLAAQIYFSDLVPADIVDTYVNGGARRDWYNVNLPINGKIAALINFNEFLKNRGDLIEAVDTALEKIKFQLEGGRGFILFDTGDADSRYDISSFMLEGEINGGLDRVAIENADFYLGEQKVTLDFNVSGLEDYLLEDSKKNLRLSLTADIRKLKFDDLYTYWPRYVAPDAWEWCRDSIFGGDAKNARFEFDFGYDEKTKTFGLTDLKGKAYIADSNLRYINTMPMVNNVYGVFSVTPTSINIALDKAVSDGIMLSEGNVLIYDLDKYNNYIDIRLFSNSSIADALKLIDHKPLEFTSQMGLHPEVIEGEADTELGLKFELKKDLDYDDVNVTVNSKLHNVRIKDAVDGRPITAKELEQMKSVDIGAVAPESLPDVSGMAFDTSLPREERIALFLQAVENPYCFCIGGIGVKIEFAENGPSLQDTLTDFLLRQKSGL